MLCKQRLVNPTEFGHSNKIIWNNKKRGKFSPDKLQKKNSINFNDYIKSHAQSVTNKVISLGLKYIDINSKEQVSLKIDEDDVKSFAEDTTKNLSKNNGSVDVIFVE